MVHGDHKPDLEHISLLAVKSPSLSWAQTASLALDRGTTSSSSDLFPPTVTVTSFICFYWFSTQRKELGIISSIQEFIFPADVYPPP